MSTAQAKTHKARILVVAADLQVQKLLKAIFAAGGYEASFAADGEGAIRAQAGFRPELVVLDLDLSELRGRDVIPGIRRQSDVPVIALSNRHKEGDVVNALDLGADDFIEMPFRASELLARVRAALRRPLAAKGEKALFQCGSLLIDIVDHRVTRDGAPIKLAPGEFVILSLLVRSSGHIVSHQKLLEALSAAHCCRNRHGLHTRISSLRRKIEDDPNSPKIVLTELRIGYRVAHGAEQAASKFA
jgi:two-component system, OmpR family, KDP operon response regulator KdpE